MARRPRVDLAGFHHIVNRGVAQSDIFLCDEDKATFLEILCKACDIYKVNVHDYCLMDNHFHLLVETTDENLSLFMRRISSNHAVFFNKKYKRTGHLWQGRYKSWYIVDETYLYTLFRYIEHNPIEAKMVQKIGEYPFTLLATLLDPSRSPIGCAEHSRLWQEIENEGVQDHLAMALTPEEIEALEAERKRKIVQSEHTFRQEKSKTLQEHFSNCSDLSQRNKAIINAIEDGYRQSDIARFLELSPAAVSKVFRGV